MAQLLRIDPHGWYGLRKATRGEHALRARITSSNARLHIELSDGRKANFDRDPHVSSSTLIAAAMQWARRHGAGSIELEVA